MLDGWTLLLNLRQSSTRPRPTLQAAAQMRTNARRTSMIIRIFRFLPLVPKWRTVKWYLGVVHVLAASAEMSFRSGPTSLQDSRLQGGDVGTRQDRVGYIGGGVYAMVAIWVLLMPWLKFFSSAMLPSSFLLRFDSIRDRSAALSIDQASSVVHRTFYFVLISAVACR